jgi:hypothetical protein
MRAIVPTSYQIQRKKYYIFLDFAHFLCIKDQKTPLHLLIYVSYIVYLAEKQIPIPLSATVTQAIGDCKEVTGLYVLIRSEGGNKMGEPVAYEWRAVKGFALSGLLN